jgi:hypothetical protein
MRHSLALFVPPLVVCAALLLICAAPARAQTDVATLNATISGMARLSLSSASLTFPDADPDAVPQIAAAQGPITITARARASATGAVTLTVRASSNLRSGLDTIPAANITWTATGAGFVGGTLSAAAARTIASWTGSGVRTGTQTFRFRNAWTYPTGTYTLTMTFTLTAL